MEAHGAAKGRSAIYDAIMAGVQTLQPSQLGDSIYLITDGEDNSSKTPESELRKALSKNEIRLFPFLLPKDYVTEEGRAGYRAISDLAGDSGGYVFTAEVTERPLEKHKFKGPTADELRLQTTFLVNVACGFYTLNVVTNIEAGKPSRVTVEALNERLQTRKDLQLDFPHSLYGTSCASN
jgi:hypothetical protein